MSEIFYYYYDYDFGYDYDYGYDYVSFSVTLWLWFWFRLRYGSKTLRFVFKMLRFGNASLYVMITISLWLRYAQFLRNFYFVRSTVFEVLFFLSFFSFLTYGLKNALRYQYTILVIIKRAILILSNYILKWRIILTMRWFYLILGLVDRFFFWNWFRFRTGFIYETVYWNRFLFRKPV